MDSELNFHKEMLDIFTSVRDLHTNYMLPSPFLSYFAFLPFQIESYIENNKRQFLVTKIAKGYENLLPSTFKPGVDITYWNGIPMQHAVEINANKNAGSNLAARFARGLQRMVRRPMITSLPPDEEWVLIGYMTDDDLNLEYRQEWLVSSKPLEFSSLTSRTRSTTNENVYNIGVDLTTDLVNEMNKILFAPENVIERGRHLSRAASIMDLIKKAEGLTSVMSEHFLAKKVSDSIGYIKIIKFSLEDHVSTVDFINEFLRLIMQLPKRGLIIDVRGNGGGRITAAECLLQLLTPKKIMPEPYQFISSPLTIDMTRRINDLKSWALSLSQSITTGSSFSQGFPITSLDNANSLGQQYHGPVVLITDALCYSATDLFAAGFQDHQIGPIIGIDENTGAGGANVWKYNDLNNLLIGTKHELKALPLDTNMRVSIRRNMRVGKNAGTPVEDLGVTPDLIYNITRRDLLEDSVDLLQYASGILAAMPVRQLDMKLSNQINSLDIELTTVGISGVDIYIDGRPVLSQNINDGINKLNIPAKDNRIQLEIVGFMENKVVATRKVFL
jgi:hypothetical protein